MDWLVLPFKLGSSLFTMVSYWVGKREIQSTLWGRIMWRFYSTDYIISVGTKKIADIIVKKDWRIVLVLVKAVRDVVSS